jgi:DNA-directed RNA polymerase specialized sigma24 family protein
MTTSRRVPQRRHAASAARALRRLEQPDQIAVGVLHAVAYRVLGSLSEADDAVQEAWLRLSRSDAGSIANLGG